MINVIDLIKQVIKKEIYNETENSNKAARQVLSEMKTKFIDIKGDITSEIQYKMLQKMKKDRENSIKIYTEAFEKSNSSIAKDNLEKATNELKVIESFLAELESDMPKKMSEEEIKEFMTNTWKDICLQEANPNKGMLMKALKMSGKNIDMALASKLSNEICS